MGNYWHVILEAFIDTVKILPLLFLVYYIIELIEFKYAIKIQNNKQFKGKASPLYGALLGCIPQCGFSVVSTDLYSKGAMSVGALIAVFIATSDEAIPLMLSNPSYIHWMIALIVVKIFIGIIIGYLSIIFYKMIFKKEVKYISNEKHIHEHEHHEHGNVEEVVENKKITSLKSTENEDVKVHGVCCRHDVESKTLKRSEHSSDVNEYNHLWMYKYDDNGLLIKQLMFDRGHAYAKGGKKKVLGFDTINWLAEKEGFPSLMKKEWSEEFVNIRTEIFQNNQIGDKFEYKYDEKGKIIEQIQQMQIEEEIITSKTVNGLNENIIRDIYGNFISHQKELLSIKIKNSEKSITENYDENGKLIYTTTKIFSDYLNEPKTIKDENGNDIKILSEEQIIKEYPNGEIVKEIFYEKVF